MFLCQPLVEVLAGRGIEDIDNFLKVPSWNDLPDPFSIPSMEQATARVLCAVRNRERITIQGDYECDGGPRNPHLTRTQSRPSPGGPFVWSDLSRLSRRSRGRQEPQYQ